MTKTVARKAHASGEPVLARERAAVMRLYIDLTHAIHDCCNDSKREIDGSAVLVAAAVLLGHATGRPMNATEIAEVVRLPRTTVGRELHRC